MLLLTRIGSRLNFALLVYETFEKRIGYRLELVRLFDSKSKRKRLVLRQIFMTFSFVFIGEARYLQINKIQADFENIFEHFLC